MSYSLGPKDISVAKVSIIIIGCIGAMILVIGLGMMIVYSENSSPPNGYLSTTSREVVFLEFTTSHGSLSGSAHVVRLSTSGAHATAATGSISGTISDNAVTIEDRNAVLTPSGSNIGGVIQGSNLVLEFPENGGRLEAVTFKRTLVSSYNTAVAKLQKGTNRSYRGLVH
jgi:hypothetical protein